MWLRSAAHRCEEIVWERFGREAEATTYSMKGDLHLFEEPIRCQNIEIVFFIKTLLAAHLHHLWRPVFVT
jgi:hypothetical protein